MTTIVILVWRSSTAFWTRCSFSESSALVASSRINIDGCRTSLDDETDLLHGSRTSVATVVERHAIDNNAAGERDGEARFRHRLGGRLPLPLRIDHRDI